MEDDLQSSLTSEWEKSQQVRISVDLISLAKQELKFLAVVDCTPALKNPQVLARAIDRYLNCWLPYASKFESTYLLVPPLDCGWVWHCHKLNPVQYAKDCQQLFNKLVDVAIPMLDYSAEVEATTIEGWEKEYKDEPYHFVRAGECSSLQQDVTSRKTQYTITYDLAAAVERQTSFYYQVSRPWMDDDRFLLAALKRYQGFLYLIKRARERAAEGGPPPFVVPTYDIDLMWHSHQLCPTAYKADTIECMGQILDHDDSDSSREAGAKLDTSFVDTCGQWLATFGTVYEHAGSLYRGPEPSKSVPHTLEDQKPLNVVTGYPVSQVMPPNLQGNIDVSKRQTLQVNLVLMGAENIFPHVTPGRTNFLYIRVTALRKCPDMRLTTSPIECSSDGPVQVEWNEGFSLQAEVSTLGLRIELMQHLEKQSKGGQSCFHGSCWKLGSKKKSKCLGEVSIKWENDLLGSLPELFSTKWAELMPKQSQLVSGAPEKYPRLRLSVSITPPVPAPYIFRMIHAPVTDDARLQVAKRPPKDGVRQVGRWITRSVVDHSGCTQFVIRARWASGAKEGRTFPKRVGAQETVINVHRGTFEELGYVASVNYHSESLVRAPNEIVGSARLTAASSSDSRMWSLFDGSLNVTKPLISNAPCFCQIRGNFGYPVTILSGRWLDYEVNAKSVHSNYQESEESQFLTLIRYTPDAPLGKATALINWHSGAIEVKPEESVVMVLLISSAITLSFLDMDYQYPTFQGSKTVKHSRSEGHLGAMLVERNGLSAQWNRRSSAQYRRWEESNFLLYSLFWWQLSSAQIYASGAFGGAQCGGGCGGGACGSAGACGGGCAAGCGGGGGCGGGCGGGGGG